MFVCTTINISITIIVMCTSGTMDSWFNVPTTKISIFILLLKAWVLFDGVLSLRVSLKIAYQLKFSVLNKVFYYKYVV